MIAHNARATLLANRHLAEAPFITVAIPHYKNVDYLKRVVESVFQQAYSNFELLISNDCSPDDSDLIIPKWFEDQRCDYSYYSQSRNLGYDGNVRFCLSQARGKYVLLIGNDDALAHCNVLQQLEETLSSLGYPDVAFTNYEDWETHQVSRRALFTKSYAGNVETALKFYRSFSFVGGLVFKHEQALKHETDKWDRSVYYQIYLAVRIISSGGYLASLDVTAVSKDVRIEGQKVFTYVDKWKEAEWSFKQRHTGVDSVLRVTWDAMKPYLSASEQSRYARRLISNAYATLHPYWVMEYRRVANWSFAVGVARGHSPGVIFKEYPLNPLDKFLLVVQFYVITVASLTIPLQIFARAKSFVASWLRRRQQT